ncbi:MAG: cadherin-like domain-containing protein [Bacteroidia bacterium]|nr:cadherin-like domain-containing protein [Bacteroidia bacterium]
MGSSNLFASHFAGGELSYQHQTGNTWQVTLKYYRDCAGIEFSQTEFISILPSVGSVGLPLFKRTDITPLCPGQTSNCAPSFAGSGLEEWIFRGNVTLNPLPSGNYTISASSGARNSALTNIVPSNWYIDAELKSHPSVSPPNNSPVFQNVPFAKVCVGSLVQISPNASDPDGDALSYALVACSLSSASTVSYNAGFGPFNPFTTSSGVNINSQTGVVSFTPTTTQVGVVCIEVTETRNIGGTPTVVGKVVRDIQVQVVACNNTPPVVTTGGTVIVPSSTPNGTQFCQPFTAFDADGDNITLSLTGGPAGAFLSGVSCSGGTCTGNVCWTYNTANQGQTFTVSVNALDDACPAPGSGNGTYNVVFAPPCNAVVTCSGTNETGSNTHDGTASVTGSGFGANVSYAWTGPNGYSSNNPNISGLAPGTYTVTVTDINSCAATCSYTVLNGCPNLQLTTSPVNVSCHGLGDGSIDLTISPSGTGANVSWTGPNGFTSSSEDISNLGPGTYSVTVTVAGCPSASASVTITEPPFVTPTANDDNFTVNTCGSFTFTAAQLLANDSDPQGDPLKVDAVGSVSSGTLVDNNDGTFTYTPAPGSTNGSTVCFTYLIKKDDGYTAFPGTGHFYEFVSSPAITWTAANADANTRTYQGLQGYLATITSSQENAFAAAKLQGIGWIGASDAAVEGTWQWVTGPEAGTTFWIGGPGGSAVTYANWNTGEPNNSGNEDYGHMILNPQIGIVGSWNDLPNFVGSGAYTPQGYVVEYGGLESCTPVLTASANVCITLIDQTPPTALCQNVTVNLDAAGNGSITANDVNAGSYDDCGLGAINVTPSSFNCSNLGNNGVTLTVNDINGNSAQCSATVTVVDNIGPVASCKDVTVQLNASGNGSITANDVNNGSSDNCSIASITASPLAFDCSKLGQNSVTLTVVDGSGASKSCTATATVVDNLAPNAICQDVTVSLDASGNGSTSANAVDDGSTDNCSIASKTLDVTSFNCSNVGGNPVELTVTDGSGNSSVCSANVTVVDNVAPAANCQDVTVQLNSSGNASTTAGAVDNGSSDACGIASLTLNPTSFNCSNVGSNGVTLTVTDNNGNTSSCSANVTVEDNVAPVALCQNVTVQLDASGSGSTSANAVNNGSSDACGIASLSLSTTSFNCGNVGGNAVTLTVTDNNGNSSSCSANVQVEDNVAPVANCQDVTVQLDASGNGSTTAGAVDNGSGDACGIASIGLSQTSFNCSNVGSNGVTLTVTDVNGNVSTCTASVTVEDNVAPIANCQDVTVQLDANGNGSTSAGAVDNGSNDACGIASIALSQTSFNCSNVGSNGVTLTVTDNNGNVSTCSANVAVEDNIDPVALCQDVTVQLDASGNGSTTAGAVDNGSNDACGIASLALSATSFNCGNVGANPVTLTVTDNNGNVSTCSANVQVEDNVAPVALCQNVTVQLDDQGQGSTTAGAVDNGSNDACGIASISLSTTSFDCSDLGSNGVVLTVTDVNGNVSTCSANVEVEDNIAPSIVCPAAVNLECLIDIPAANTSLPVTSDNCSVVAVNHLGDVNNGASGCAGNPFVITRTYEAVDQSGNATTCTQTITVEATPIIVSTSTSPDHYVFPAYGDSACAALSSSAFGGCGNYSIMWSTGETTANITVCPTVSTTYYVTYTDVEGCSGTDSIRICVIDITCVGGDNNGQGGNGQGGQGQNNSTSAMVHVAMCHIPPGNPNNAMTKCLPIPAVQAHMQQVHGGDHLGACGSVVDRDCDFNAKRVAKGAEPGAIESTRFEAFPNPFTSSTTIRFTLGQNAFVNLKVYAVNGAEIATLCNEEVLGGIAKTVEFVPQNVSEGVYFAKLVTSTGEVITHKLILVK